jgi:phosphatidylinositol alpha-1,6-mannosyltransferase
LSFDFYLKNGGDFGLKSLLISRVFPPHVGGSGRWLWEVYSRLPRDQYTIMAGQHPSAADFDATHGVDVRRMPLAYCDWGAFSWNGWMTYRRGLRQLLPVVRREGIEAIHCGSILPEGWLGWRLKKRLGIPFFCFVHGEELSLASKSRELGFMMRLVLREAGMLIANSDNTRGLLTREWGIKASKCPVLHPGVDTEKFRPAPVDEAFRRTQGWHDRLVLLTVGRLQKRKGHDMLIRALPRLRADFPSLLYAIVGAGEERRSLETQIEELGVSDMVSFLGEVPDETLVRCYQQCDLFVLPNRNLDGDIEGFGMVLVEAQACGKPVLAGASGGTSETMWIPHTGRVVNCDNPEDLTVAVRDLIRDRGQLHTMGLAAHRWAVEHFDWSTLAEQAEILFQRDFLTPKL